MEEFANTYIYYPSEKNEINFFENEKAYFIRNGLCIYSLSSMHQKNFNVHRSLMNNFILKILMRGMPKLYEYNINQKYKKISSANFTEVLMQKILKLYDTVKIPKINIRKIKIKSQIFFQISYYKESEAWIVSDSTKNCVIFHDIDEVSALFKEKKISKNMCRICEECYSLFENILKKKNVKYTNKTINHNIFAEISKNTFLGFFLPDTEEIIFYYIVSNLQYNVEQFGLPITEIEDICFKFGLPYEKCITLKTDLVTFEQAEKELKVIYRRISEDYASFQSFGAIVLIEQDNEIITGYKVLNQEMKIIKKMQNIKFNLNKNINLSSNKKLNISTNVENEQLNQLMYEFSHYQLPRCIHSYLKLFHNIKIEDSLNKCLDNLEEISKNIYQNCSCNNGKSLINNYSLNLLSCLIPLDYVENFDEDETNDKDKNQNNSINKSNIENNSLKSKTLKSSKSHKEINNFPYFRKENADSSFKMPNYFFNQNPELNKKKTKKRVKFVDEVYNKSLIEEIFIKSFKGYNMKNNFANSRNSTDCNVFKNSKCCIIF